MKNNTYKLLRDEFGIAEPILDLIDESEKQVSSHFSQLDDTMAYNQYKVLEAFQRNNIRDMHFSWNTGYGYDDPGRDAVERVYADILPYGSSSCPSHHRKRNSRTDPDSHGDPSSGR